MAAIAIVFLVVGVIFKHDAHIKLTLVTGRFSPKGQQLITVVNDLVVLAFCCAFLYWSAKWALYPFAIGRESSELLGVPVGIFHVPLPIGGVVWAFYTIERLIKDIVSWRARPTEVVDTTA
jgi:TRAP-type C4-dicarboxylate transport system permease small subunit